MVVRVGQHSVCGSGLGSPLSHIFAPVGRKNIAYAETIAFQLYDYLTKIKKIKRENILYLQADEIHTLLNKGLYEIILEYLNLIHQSSFVELKENVFILIDEAHYDKNWAQSLKVIFDKTDKIFLFVTGSSALLLEMSTDVARRALKECVFPLNLSEYLMLKYNIFPKKGTADAIRQLLFNYNVGSLNYFLDFEDAINKKLLKISKSTDNEIKNFVNLGGFAFAIRLGKYDVYKRTVDIIDRIIRKDIPIIKSFSTKTQNDIFRIITFIASQKIGSTSHVKIAKHLEISSALVKEILDSLEKTHLIFSVKPFSRAAGKPIRKPWKYYFLTPTFISSILSRLGRYDENDAITYGKLIESLIASYLFRMKNTIGLPNGIFYDPYKGGVDFLLYDDITQKVIPLEVSSSPQKSKKQIKSAARRYKANYGIIISNREKTEIDGNIVYIPLKSFLFV